MIFSCFRNVSSKEGRLCDVSEFWNMTEMKHVNEVCKSIAEKVARGGDKEQVQMLKKTLPVITWQASFNGSRTNANAVPSGLFMLDIDHVERPYELYRTAIVSRRDDLGIVYCGMTPSTHGLRVVAKCRREYKTIGECQQWLAQKLGVEYDAACKDWARASYVVPSSYIYYIDGNLFVEEPQVVYNVEDVVQTHTAAVFSVEEKKEPIREGEVGNAVAEYEYKGLSLRDIAKEWLIATGGEPAEGERNTRLYQLALRLRYITDFDESKLVCVLPAYGLSTEEIRQIAKHAVSANRSQYMPEDLDVVLCSMTKGNDEEDDEEFEEVNVSELPPLPPLIREMTECAPDDFKQATVLCQLPILGALGSKLRAVYLDGRVHEPSFQVSLEAPQASGKSFMTRLAEYELEQIIMHDDVERAREEEYNSKVREMKLMNVKVDMDTKDAILGKKPEPLIRYVSPKISITKLFMRLKNAQGLHLFAVCPEIDTVTKTFKSGFSSYSDLLRVAFDSEMAGQDYASEMSFSGNVRVRYNTLFSGTPKAMCRFYPDIEDGLVSRVLFVTLPDQFGKKMPVWKKLSVADEEKVQGLLCSLNDISIVGEKVQDEHVMKLNWLNVSLQAWLDEQQKRAVRENSRTRDIFCRRAAVVGFRAGMLAFFLWGEYNTPTIRRNVVRFSKWVAESMLRQHLLRFDLSAQHSNVNKWGDVYELLGDEFSRDEAQEALRKNNNSTPVKMVLYKWRMLGIIEPLDVEKGRQGQLTMTKFRKIK